MPRGKSGTGRLKPIFRGLNIAISGIFDGQWTDAKISHWVSLRAGTFSRRMSEDVTHFICTEEEFDKKGPKVKAALARAYKKDKKCYIVSFDWLEDSLFGNKRLPEDEYSHVASLKALREKARLERKMAKGVEEEDRAVNENFYHVYWDPTDLFQYNITLFRDDEKMGITGERYVVKLHESNALPHLYQVAVRYYKSKNDTKPKLHRLSETPGDFQREYDSFKRFFKIKVGYPWDERLVRGVGSLGANFFSYQPPTGGKPVGWVPEAYIPKEPTTPPEADVNNTSSEFASSNQTVLVPSGSEADVNAGLESMPSAQPTSTLVPDCEVTREEVPTSSSSQEGSQDQTQQNDQSQQHHDESHTSQHDTHEEVLETATENALPTQDGEATGDNATVNDLPVSDGKTQVV
ncbi:hypothetical protein QBC32DRAFT_385378 [Pseudoneurospora amorphoporcata]|uniref:BRCT domain-containing protein n=1 Tax=Pseudoneurospora amorphoporcata TaxID=241081 RepID=A0AAN6SHR9_9PEZI|nr:hypothetical protein QBC32DRAFT_385378 [Pseudoneurospora amorphoporcata]